MDLENLVANQVLVKAREANKRDSSQGRSSKWRQLLRFPLIDNCEHLRSHLEARGELSTAAILVQPLGRRLLSDFFSARGSGALGAKGTALLTFLEGAERYSLTLRYGSQLILASKLYSDHVAQQQQQNSGGSGSSGIGQTLKCLAPFDEKVDAHIKARDVPRDLFSECIEAALEELGGEPMQAFTASPFFSRLLQWRLLEFRPLKESQFRFYRVLGKGAFGDVYAAQRKETGQMYAIKRMEKKRVKSKNAVSAALNERFLLEAVHSNFAVELTYAFESKSHLFLAMTLMDSGDLRYHIRANKRLSVARARYYAAQLVLGLQDIHDRHILYRDLKPENVLLDARGNARISDFGLAVEVPPGKAAVGRVGTPGYMAPEVVSRGKYGESCDWFSLGATLFEMIEGHGPFRNSSKKAKILQKDMDDRVNEHEPEYAPDTDKQARALCEVLLEKQREDRLGYAGGPGHRWRADRIESHAFFQEVRWLELIEGTAEPPFKPDSGTLYASDLGEIEPFSVAGGANLDEADKSAFDGFTAANTLRWQSDILGSVYDEHSVFDPEKLPKDLEPGYKEGRRFLLLPPPKRPSFSEALREAYLKQQKARGLDTVARGAGRALPLARHASRRTMATALALTQDGESTTTPSGTPRTSASNVIHRMSSHELPLPATKPINRLVSHDAASIPE